jgi:putative transcriptional regulator
MKNKLKIYRTIQDLTQEQLAIKVQVSRQTIHAVENGKYVPSTVLALKIAAVLCTDVACLFELEERDWG